MPETELSLREAQALKRYERKIEDAVESTGESLYFIRQDKLYRQDYPTFDAYCRGRWDMDPSTAHRLAEAYALRTKALELAPSKEVKTVIQSLAAPLREFGPSLVGSPAIEKRAEVLVEFAKSVEAGGSPTVNAARQFVLENRMPGYNAVAKRGPKAKPYKDSPQLGAFKQGYTEGYKDCARAHDLTITDAEVIASYRMASGEVPPKTKRRSRAA